MKDKNRVCPPEKAGSLDSFFRRIIHNPNRILKRFVKEGMVAVDIGCGPGHFSVEMAELVGQKGKVFAADLQTEMLKKLELKIKGKDIDKRIILHKCEKDKIGLNEKADFVLAFYMVHEVPSQEKLFSEIKAMLKEKGRVLIVEPNFQVSKKEFAETIGSAEKSGFRVLAKPRILFSRSAVLEKI